jgi:hypothetical protein
MDIVAYGTVTIAALIGLTIVMLEPLFSHSE